MFFSWRWFMLTRLFLSVLLYKVKGYGTAVWMSVLNDKKIDLRAGWEFMDCRKKWQWLLIVWDQGNRLQKIALKIVDFKIFLAVNLLSIFSAIYFRNDILEPLCTVSIKENSEIVLLWYLGFRWEEITFHCVTQNISRLYIFIMTRLDSKLF